MTFSSKYEQRLWEKLEESVAAGSFDGFSSFVRTSQYRDIASGVIRDFIDTKLAEYGSGYFSSNGIHLFDGRDNRSDYAIQELGRDQTYLMAGKGGSDYLATDSRDDILSGEGGDDFLSGGQGNDTLIGGEGNDTVSYQTALFGIVTKLESFKTFSDGSGGADTLISIENVIGTSSIDRIYGDDGQNILVGGAGWDRIYSGGGDDIIIGGSGRDIIKAGDGNDIIMGGTDRDYLYGQSGSDIFKFGAEAMTIGGNYVDSIRDFETGIDGDKIDVSAILDIIGYTGTDPIADGYIVIKPYGSRTKIMFDRDGHGDEDTSHSFAILETVSADEFSPSESLIFNSTRTLYTPFLGQSNARGMRMFKGDDESGVTRMEDGLKNLTDYDDVFSVDLDENGRYIDLAVGGSGVNGDLLSKDFKALWFPESTDEPGPALIRAVDIMSIQMAKLQAAGTIKPAFIWSQGEAAATWIGRGGDPEGDAQFYKETTRKVFDYIQDHLGDDIEFYIMRTGHYLREPALNLGMSEERIDEVQAATEYVKQVQLELAKEYDDVHLAAVYDDLPMKFDVDPVKYSTDCWHLDSESYEIVGDRLAQFIAVDLGQSHVIADPGPYPREALADISIEVTEGQDIAAYETSDIIAGTLGDDEIHAGSGDDMIVSGSGADFLYGDDGSDLFYFDPSVWQELFVEQPPAESYIDYADVIFDFETGEGGDKLDISVLLDKAGYTGNDAISDGYLTLSDHEDGLHFDFDPDGTDGAAQALTIATASDVLASSFDPEFNLITTLSDTV